MGPEAREMRIENIRKKMAARRAECLELAIQSSSPRLSPASRSELNHHREQAIEQYESLQFMLGVYQRQS
jgi:hypothetical protein